MTSASSSAGINPRPNVTLRTPSKAQAQFGKAVHEGVPVLLQDEDAVPLHAVLRDVLVAVVLMQIYSVNHVLSGCNCSSVSRGSWQAPTPATML